MPSNRVIIPEGAKVISRDELIILNEYIRVCRRIIMEVMYHDPIYLSDELKDSLKGYDLFVEEFDLLNK